MTNLFDKLNLTPAERRLVVIVGIVVFVVLNFWQVFPMFGDYGKYLESARLANITLKKYQDEVAKRSSYEKERTVLKGQGSEVQTEEAALRLTQEINSQAALSGVTVTSIQPMTRQSATGKTNAFFEEATVTVSVNTGEKELIDFLFRLADKERLIRAKSMNISTDPSQMRLQGPIQLVKSFQRRPPPKVAAAAAAAAKAAPPTSAPAPTAAKPLTAAPPTVAPQPAPVSPVAVPPPVPVGGTNRPRRSLPTPVKP